MILDTDVFIIYETASHIWDRYAQIQTFLPYRYSNRYRTPQDSLNHSTHNKNSQFLAQSTAWFSLTTVKFLKFLLIKYVDMNNGLNYSAGLWYWKKVNHLALTGKYTLSWDFVTNCGSCLITFWVFLTRPLVNIWYYY